MAVNAYLHFDDQEYRLLNLHYHYEQAVEVTGRPMAKPTGGQFRIRLNATDKSKDNFLPWMLDPEGVKNGTIFVYGHDLLQVEKTIHFTDAYCIYHSLEFLSTGSAPLILDVVISARKLEINGEVYENPWPKISDYQGLEAPKRVASSSAQPVQKQEQAEALPAVTSAPAPKQEKLNALVDVGNGVMKKRLKTNHSYTKNGYNYKTDDLGRIVEAEGKLRIQKGNRSKYHQRTVGKDDGRLAGDHGGHLIGTQYDGAKDKSNLVPMAELINNYHEGEWGQMEKRWANELKNGNGVHVKVLLMYDDNSMRPSVFQIKQSITDKETGKTKTKKFQIENPK